MFARTIFEYLAILLITAGLMVFVLFTPASLIIGAGLVISGVATLFKHYAEKGADHDIFA